MENFPFRCLFSVYCVFVGQEGYRRYIHLDASEQITPLIVTTIAVSLLKVAAIAGAILLIKWIVGKIKRNK